MTHNNESKMYGLAANLFYKIISMATGIDMSNASDLKLLDRKAINVMIDMQKKCIF